MKVTVYTDGGARGNPGVAGSGSVVYGPQGDTLAEIAYVVGQESTNNVAEYTGLVRGLEAAAEAGASEVDVYLDSKLVVEQMNGRWKIKHPDMKKLAREANAIASRFDAVTYTWVPRAKNKKADELSNVAMDAAEKGAPVGVVGGSPEAQSASAPAASPGDADGHVVAGPAHWSGCDQPRTRFVLLRHGQTEHSANHCYSGSSDPQLTDAGREQARRAAAAVARLGAIDVVVSSPSSRALDTAHACAEALGINDVEVADGFREMDFGAFEGLTREQAMQRHGEDFAAWEASATAAPPGGESLAQLHRRVTRARLKLQEEHAGKTILVVTHMAPIKSVVRQAMGAGVEVFRHVFLDLASISVAEFYGDFGVVRCVNDVSHHR
ncbi:bifunctional RNase H/acid phosphatase [Corynebacterium timonense]|uniref:Probable phosphoglycerate mutase n=1 Tax=Corynebacterium timonense TaxID=441500 RepID=A0A1H1MBD2_9CORY|nr:bifunctional RNase H/acid phosphatase [Corynebacterium timonense]SDR84111.1 probable phosphoglycerate mutase [Corynebacterium timonense]